MMRSAKYREAGGGGRPRCTPRAWGGLDCRPGAGHGEKRTLNMPTRPAESKRGHTVRDEVRATGEGGGRGAEAAQAACRGRPRHKTGRQGTRGAHIEHEAHVLDAERVEAQRLVKRRRGLPIKCRAYEARRGAGRKVGGRGGGSGASVGRNRLKAGGTGRSAR
eukprot:scaffold16922_cov51-Phaeocystis_antarctica.AAC.3